MLNKKSIGASLLVRPDSFCDSSWNFLVPNPDSASINPVGKHKSGSKPDLDQIWDQNFSTSVCSLEIDTAGTNFNRALEGGDFTVLIYYLSLHHQGDRGTKTKCENYIFCLRGSKNIFHILGSEFGPPDDRSPPPASRQAKSGFGTRKFQDELEMALVFRSRGLWPIRYWAHDTPIHMRCWNNSGL